jgi:hypothetical protein
MSWRSTMTRGVGAGGGSGGCVRRLRDLDGTDRAEESIVLASELN